MQDHPKAPGNARQGTPGTDGPAACGGAAAQSPAPGHTRPRATPMPAHAHAEGAEPRSVPRRADAHAERAGPRRPWPSAGRPERAATHHPLAGLGAPAAPGSLAPRRCHSPHPPSLPAHRSVSARRRRSCISRPAGTDPPTAHHRGRGLSPAPPLARPTQGRPPTTYPCQPMAPPAWQADVCRYPTAARRSAWSACASVVMRLSRAPSRMLGRLLVVRRTR